MLLRGGHLGRWMLFRGGRLRRRMLLRGGRLGQWQLLRGGRLWRWPLLRGGRWGRRLLLWVSRLGRWMLVRGDRLGDGYCLGVVVWEDSRYWCFLCTYLLEFPSPFLSSSTTKGWKCAGHRGNNRYINTFLPYVSNANSWRDGRISYKQTEQTLSCTMETRLTKEQKTRAPIHLPKKQNHWILSVFCLIDEGLQILSFSISRTKKG